ncbi:Pyruvate:ferredoxin oxidoreductase [Sporomusa acidovorans DSM 3132]|uniref:Pyruvate:ferredoxin oxidoreductase n=1 Tax=Sporomusa acidovorans (strain ATCC 49682 / DSM 3132 / Mol) TaxID=1123286 RepID=A0ABZ3JA66_SPOA4|nr:pyruvate-flavodoxin oxidoreductase [Sporomusa acidovorans DSM 3132]SDD60729.1 pyruvate:ferredoxin (flavodoxin) oxidoreductase, homodimeric [Sporomusa acidovorans]
MYAQAYFAYDSKKSGGVTISHLRFGKQPIKAPYLIHKADFIACHNQSYVDRYNVLEGLKQGGSFLLNCTWNERELAENLPTAMKRYIWENKINFYIIDAVGIAQKIGLGGRINMIMQAAFFKIADIIPVEEATNYLKEAVLMSYGKKGDKVVAMNNAAIDTGVNASVKVRVPASWGNVQAVEDREKPVPAFVKNILVPMNRQEGDALPVSALIAVEDGTFPLGTAAYEKRGIAITVPAWQADKCIQCNQCAYVCPHAAIRPVLVDEKEMAKVPAAFVTKPATGIKDMNFRMAVSPLDCTGCGNCAQICPAQEKALVMEPLATQLGQAELWEYALSLTPKPNPIKKETVKGSQFEQALLEFSGACAGCGETPYAKLVTQLFGDRMMVANATGCSSVWAGSTPSIPYTTNHCGHGPAWGNSLFEDNAEYGLGMLLGVKQLRNKLSLDIEQAVQLDLGDEWKAACKEWLEHKDSGQGTREKADRLIAELEKVKSNEPLIREIYKNKDFLVKRSHWIFGGDGWAYDIGFGGLEHVLASGEDVNVLVFDTEVYSNTGGQSSKATPTAAIAKFAASGKRTGKKDLGMIAMSYGYVYVAQIAMGADKNQTLKAIVEAEAYPGPSLVIAYAPCINHGLKAGMSLSQQEAKRAVDSGYWLLYRYNPQAKEAGQKTLLIDSKEPTIDFKEFLMGEVRYSSLQKQFPDVSEVLFEKTKQDARARLERYRQLAGR